MHWFSKIHKTPDRAKFIIASKNCSTKPLSGVISKVFKMLFKHVEYFHKKIIFFSSYKKFLVMENSFPIIEKLDIIKTRKKVKHISTYDFSTLYTTIPHNLLIKVFSDIIHFVFKSKVCSKIGFSPASIY